MSLPETVPQGAEGINSLCNPEIRGLRRETDVPLMVQAASLTLTRHPGAGVIRSMKMVRLLFLLFWCAGSLTGRDRALAEDFMAKGRDLEARTLYGPAIAEYRRAIEEDPANAAEAHYRIGVLSNQLGNSEGAVQEFRVALQLNPNHTEARKAATAFYVNRGATARRQQRLAEALRDLQEAVKIDPGASIARVELGQAYEESGRLPEAVQEYQAAVNADAKNLTAQLRLGQALNAQQQYAQAVRAFTAVLEGNPAQAEAYAGLGVAYFHQGQRDEAKKAFDQAIRKHLVAGRRDPAQQVKEKADALLSPTPPVQGR